MEPPHFYFVAIFTIFTVAVIPGNSEPTCDFDKSCLLIYNNMKTIWDEGGSSEMGTLCSMSHDLRDCMKRSSRRCRGDLNYHFFEKLVRDINAAIGVSAHCNGRFAAGTDGGSDGESRSSTQKPRNSNSSSTARRNRCAPKHSDSEATAGCALFGLTNLKSFSEHLNYSDISYCSLAGAWNLIDTPEFAVQITNKGGLSPLPKDITATTLVTVIVKNHQCALRRTYQATFDEVPGMFADGWTTAGNVYIETVVESEHVKIHFPHLSTTIDVIKVLDKIPIPSLTVAIRMPSSLTSALMSEPKRLRGLPLCFYGCPRPATIKPKTPALNSNLNEAPLVSPRSAVSAPLSANSQTSLQYYKSQCPHPDSDLNSELEQPQADAGHDRVPRLRHRPRSEFSESEFSASLSAEFLSQSEGENFGGPRVQRNLNSPPSAVICASLNSAADALADTEVVGTKLKFPGDGFNNLRGNDRTNGEELSFSYSSALTSRSAPVGKFHLVFVYFSTILVFWSKEWS